MPRDPKVRASDADREAVADQLREHAATGRLTMDEYGERLERVFAAQTYGELDALLTDLPGPDAYPGLPVPAHSPNYADLPVRGRRDLEHRHGGVLHGAWLPWASASVICWGVWLAGVISSGEVAGVWPVWVTVPWGGVLLAGELGKHGDDPDQRRLDR